MSKMKSDKRDWKPALIKKGKLTFVVYAKKLSDRDKTEWEIEPHVDYYYIKYLHGDGLEVFVADGPVLGTKISILGDK